MLRILTTAQERALVEKYAELTRLRAVILEAELEVAEAREKADRAARILEDAMGVGNTMFRYWLPDMVGAGPVRTGEPSLTNEDEPGSGQQTERVIMTTISMGPALKILRSRCMVEEKTAAESAKLVADKEWDLGKLRKREQVMIDAIAAIENMKTVDN